MKILALLPFLLISLACNPEKNDRSKNTEEASLKARRIYRSDSTGGLIRMKSSRSAKETFTALKNAVQENPNLNIMAEVNHQQNAEQAGLRLPPTYLLIFGNPTLGTPLMQQSPSLGIDLPQKMLVYEDEMGQVWVAYNDPFYLKERHSMKGNEEMLNKISNALKSLAEAAAKE